MRKTRFAKHASVLALSTISLAVIAGCPDNNGPPSGETPPEIPPLSAFKMDFSSFNNTSTSKVMQTAAGTSLVRARAAFQVGVWQTILNVTLAVPVAAFAESFNHDPVWNEDGYWSWTYQFSAQGKVHTAELQARVVKNTVQWDMYISRQGDFENVHWFTGQTGILTKTGTWTVNRDPNEVIPFVRIDYEQDPNNDNVAQIKYTSIEEGQDLYDSYIIYATINDANYDRSYTVYSAADDNMVEIEWDHLMQDGRTRDAAYYGDDQWRCWDETLTDVECP